ncbi:hypothetical protein [Streptomyces profundus]|uniref:hypothetical protein n=1 Tax=Streptomyces profundus TaxID=2867410 RepID=UPI001D162BD3|nr:hypothetical protein [Streptomyces sp. MA3_2.13]
MSHTGQNLSYLRPGPGVGLLCGAVAGAAGTTALNAVSYLDMVLRGRASSDTPSETVERLSEVSRVPVPGHGAARANRVTGLGPLLGLATGVGVGAALGLGRAAGWRPGPLLGGTAAALGALVAANAPMAVLGVSDPRTWSAKDWLSDLLPHAAYGAATGWALAALAPSGRAPIRPR